MQYLWYSLLCWVILVTCGLPLAVILLPRELKRLALPASVIFGYCFIVFVCYYFFRANIGGTNRYAHYLLLGSLAIFVILSWRRWPPLAELFSKEVMLIGCLVLMSFLVVSSMFLLLAHGRAVALAFANMDIAELASVSRYMQEFARDTQVGFMGQSDHFMNTGDNIWFGPSMITAFLSSLTFSEPFRLQSLVMNIVAVQATAFVFVIARESLTLNRPTSLAIGICFAHQSNDCLHNMAVIRWADDQYSDRARNHLFCYTRSITGPIIKSQARYLPALVLLFSGLFVTYHFMIVFIVVFLVCYLFVLAIAERSLNRLLAGGLLVLFALALTVALNPWRLPAVWSTFSMLNSDNGWFIPWVSPDVQLGFNAARRLIDNGPDLGKRTGAVVAILLMVPDIHLFNSRA